MQIVFQRLVSPRCSQRDFGYRFTEFTVVEPNQKFLGRNIPVIPGFSGIFNHFLPISPESSKAWFPRCEGN